MKNFVIFFQEKEGTTAQIKTLELFEKVAILHKSGANYGREPFDKQEAGPMAMNDLFRCMDLIYQGPPVDFEAVNRIYTKTSRRTQTADRPLEPFNAPAGTCSIGCKMRFRPPRAFIRYVRGFSPWNKGVEFIRRRQQNAFAPRMIEFLARRDVVVFLAVRQDVFRWALSKYHGDGTGKPGHLQFKIANNRIKSDRIQRIVVDCDQLEAIIQKCERSHNNKQRLRSQMQQAGIQVYPLLYEDFLKDKHAFFRKLLDRIQNPTSDEEIAQVLSQPSQLKKVHSHDISSFVENHEEVLERFGNRFVSWKESEVLS